LTPVKKAELAVTRMKIDLNLSDEQVASVRQIQTKHFTAMEKAGTEKNAEREEMKVHHKKQMDNTGAELKRVLTDDQFRKYQQIREKRKLQREKRQDGSR